MTMFLDNGGPDSGDIDSLTLEQGLSITSLLPQRF